MSSPRMPLGPGGVNFGLSALERRSQLDVGNFSDVLDTASSSLEASPSPSSSTTPTRSWTSSMIKSVEVEILSPLHPHTNPLARELSFLFEVRRAPLDAPLLSLISDDERLFLARVEAEDHGEGFGEAIYSEDQTLIRLLS